MKTCSIEGCQRAYRARGYCAAHYMRVKNKGDVGSVEVGKPVHLAEPKRGTEHPNWAGDNISYRVAHLRLKWQRGRAASQACQHCGRPAQQWAYDHQDSNELVDEKGRRYSPDTSFYIPLCIRCHRIHDRAARSRG